jgi:hypothetical protein
VFIPGKLRQNFDAKVLTRAQSFGRSDALISAMTLRDDSAAEESGGIF